MNGFPGYYQDSNGLPLQACVDLATADSAACPGLCQPDCTCATAPAGATAAVVADTFVDSALPSTNFGHAALLSVDASSTKQIFLRVQVSGVGARPVISATVRLQVANVTSANSDSGGRIHPITGCSWDELAMTWDTRPAIDGPVLSSVGAVALNQVVDFDVTGAIPGDGTYCFAIDNPSSNGADYNAREGGVAHPAVLITTGP